MYTITKVYAIRMAGVFIIALASIWIRTRVMPWVFVINMFIQVVSLRGEQSEAEGVLGSHESSCSDS
jgi:hypothetical protein